MSDERSGKEGEAGRFPGLRVDRLAEAVDAARARARGEAPRPAMRAAGDPEVPPPRPDEVPDAPSPDAPPPPPPETPPAPGPERPVPPGEVPPGRPDEVPEQPESPPPEAPPPPPQETPPGPPPEVPPGPVETPQEPPWEMPPPMPEGPPPAMPELSPAAPPASAQAGDTWPPSAAELLARLPAETSGGFPSLDFGGWRTVVPPPRAAPAQAGPPPSAPPAGAAASARAASSAQKGTASWLPPAADLLARLPAGTSGAYPPLVLGARLDAAGQIPAPAASGVPAGAAAADRGPDSGAAARPAAPEVGAAAAPAARGKADGPLEPEAAPAPADIGDETRPAGTPDAAAGAAPVPASAPGGLPEPQTPPVPSVKDDEVLPAGSPDEAAGTAAVPQGATDGRLPPEAPPMPPDKSDAALHAGTPDEAAGDGAGAVAAGPVRQAPLDMVASAPAPLILDASARIDDPAPADPLGLGPDPDDARLRADRVAAALQREVAARRSGRAADAPQPVAAPVAPRPRPQRASLGPPLLSLRGIATDIGRYQILSDVSLDVPLGGVTVLLGRNGAGKTTTLRTIMGLWRPRAGEIRLGGENLARLPPARIARAGLAYVPEDMGIFGNLTVAENVALAARAGAVPRERLDWIFDTFPPLKRFWAAPAAVLSGGQKQMLALARAMAAPHRLYLVDEPTKGLAPAVVATLVQALRDLRQQGASILLVEQNFAVAEALGDRAVVIEDGRSVWDGPMAELAADPGLQARLLGLGREAAA